MILVARHSEVHSRQSSHFAAGPRLLGKLSGPRTGVLRDTGLPAGLHCADRVLRVPGI